MSNVSGINACQFNYLLQGRHVFDSICLSVLSDYEKQSDYESWWKCLAWVKKEPLKFRSGLEMNTLIIVHFH